MATFSTTDTCWKVLQGVRVHTSHQTEDSEWDQFLASSPLGQFQQSAMWSKVKAQGGWQVCRVTLRKEDQILGGFQLLHKGKGPLRIGYATKGPVLAEETETHKQLVLQLLCAAGRSIGLDALLFQPPDWSTIQEQTLLGLGVVKAPGSQVVEATQLVDLAGGVERVEAGFRRSTRKKIRHAERAGVTVCVGNEADIPVFFRLMLESCRRQGNVKPNPASEAAIRCLWETFKGMNGMRLTFAELTGQKIAGLLCLAFGRRLSLWKKGAMPEHHTLHAMDALYREALHWGCAQGMHHADFCALRRDIAVCLLDGTELSDEQAQSRDFYNLGFGGFPLVLPPPMIYIPNPALRTLYRGAIGCAPARSFLKRLLG